MGRDKPKKYDKMSYFQKQRYYEDQGKKYNIDRDSFENAQGGGGGRYEDFDHDGYRKAVKNAQRNDFDYRTSAQHMDGIKGDGSSADFVNYQRGAQKLHKKAGNGGQYSSNEDITTVTNNLVNDYRKGQSDYLDDVTNDINGIRTELEERKAKTQAETNPQDFEHSDSVANAQENLEKYKLNIGKTDLFNKSNEPAPRANDQKDAASAFMTGKSRDLKESSNLKEVKADNLNNAMDTVKSYRDVFNNPAAGIALAL